MTVRVLIVDDHVVVTEGLSVLLGGFPSVEVIGTAHGGAEAVERYRDLDPDVVLMDLSMPDVDGVEATRRIRALDRTARVLALTAFVDDALMVDVLRAGAVGCLPKQVGGRELCDAIDAVASGGTVVDTEALELLARAEREQGRVGAGDDLTPRELDVLALLSRGLTNQGIADELGIGHGTVRIHVSNILAKLHAENRTAAAHIAQVEGLVDVD